MKLTKSMCEVLAHRLSLETVPEVLADSDEAQVTLEQAQDAHSNIIACVAAREIPLERLNTAERLVLIECIEGGTILCDWADTSAGNSPASRLHHLKAVNALEKAINAAFGVRVRYPRN